MLVVPSRPWSPRCDLPTYVRTEFVFARLSQYVCFSFFLHSCSSYPTRTDEQITRTELKLKLKSIVFNLNPQLEWMSEDIGRAFDLQRSNPFELRNVHIMHSLEELDELGNDPKVCTARW